MRRSDIIWLILVVAGALAFSVWGLPYFTQMGHPRWAIVVYAFFVVLFIYGRSNRIPQYSNARRKLPNQK